MKYGLIGEHLPHSFSAQIHSLIGGYDYKLREINREDLGAFMEKKEFEGINVTIPYKQAVMPYLDEISGEALAIGAVNTVVNRNGKLYGYNTDIGGLKALIQRTGTSLKGKKVLILGTGGTSKTAYAAAVQEGAAAAIRLSRSPKGDAVSYEEAASLHGDAEVIINTTPCGMFPDTEGLPIDLSLFPNVAAVVDVVYNPLRTRLVSEAVKRGIKAEGGLYMLVKQAVLASELFLDTKYDSILTDKVFNSVKASKENIVLTGMPSCGKSTVGGILARLTGRPMFDTDKYLEEKHGISVPEMFTRYGEPKFRDMEAEAVRELSVESGCIIATGGGAVMRAESAERLKRNGHLYFLDRPLEELVATDDRPMSRTAEALRQRYEERYPTYLSTADSVVKVRGSAEDVAKDIIERHGKT